MFPRLSDLIEIHLEFLSKLRQRQRENPVVSSIADISLEQFSNNNAAKLKSAYGKIIKLSVFSKIKLVLHYYLIHKSL